MKKLFSRTFAAALCFVACAAFAAPQAAVKPEAYRHTLLDRFLRYVQIDSQSAYGPNDSFLLTPEVKNAADDLYAELNAVLQKNKSDAQIHISDYKYIYVNFPSNLPKGIAARTPVLGFSCHYDVTPEAPGKGIKPQVHTNYDGGVIWINKERNISIGPKTDPYLNQLLGETIVTSDGTTLLGADDKAGTAVLATVVQTLAENPSIPHGKLQIVFTPNEDVGQSAYHLDTNYYKPEISFDFDGEVNGEVMVENFTAMGINLAVPGRAAHPSEFKEQNGLDPLEPATKLVAGLPSNYWPQHSEGREPYLHAYAMEKTPTDTVYIRMRSRFFDAKDGQEQEATVRRLKDSLERAYDIQIRMQIMKQYENVAYGIHPLAKSVAEAAVKAAGVKPDFVSVRGGTTAAMFNAMWNLTGYTYFTGQQRVHSNYEWLSEKDMFASYKTALYTIEQVIKQSQNLKKK